MVLNYRVAGMKKFIQTIMRRLMNSQNEKPAGLFEVRYPIQTGKCDFEPYWSVKVFKN